MKYWKNGKWEKVQHENFRSPTEMAQRRKAPIHEGYEENYEGKKCPIWLYILLGCVALAIISLLMWWWWTSVPRGGGNYQELEMTSSGQRANERFGFRFY